MVKKITALLLLQAFIFTAGISYAADPLFLDPLIQEALKNNPGMVAAKKRWEASLARVPQAKSPEDPAIGLTLEKIPRGTFKLDRTMSEDRMLSIAQALPFFGKLSLKGKIAVVEAQIRAAEYKQTELDIINEVKNAYYDLFMNSRETRLNQESLEFLQSIAKIAEAKYSVGDMPQEALFKVTLEIANLNVKALNLKQENAAKTARLNTLLNRDPESPLGEPVLSEDASFTPEAAYLYKLTLENQPELLTFSYAIEKNKYAKSLAKKSFFPDLMMEIVQRGITSGSIGPWDLSLALSVPLWFWTKQRYEVKEAIANLEEAQAAYSVMKNRVLSETKDLVTKIEIAKNKINLYKNNSIPLLESSLASSIAGFQSGKGELMVLLDTERMLIDTKMDYYKALIAYHMSLADLERSAGGALKEVKK
jgi:outer membrane protein, heavy metal efflux system